jgi:hypothetical protein
MESRMPNDRNWPKLSFGKQGLNDGFVPTNCRWRTRLAPDFAKNAMLFPHPGRRFLQLL